MEKNRQKIVHVNFEPKEVVRISLNSFLSLSTPTTSSLYDVRITSN